MPITLVLCRHMHLVWIHPELQVLYQAVFQLNSALDLLWKYKKDTLIQLEINMIREASQNTVGYIKDILNEKKNIVER